MGTKQAQTPAPSDEWMGVDDLERKYQIPKKTWYEYHSRGVGPK